jgi:hypothetical protein
MGLPMHVLLVHAAVVFVPLLATAAVVYAVVPRLRNRVGWVAALLAVGAPVAALSAKLSGDAFRDSRAAGGAPAQSLATIDAHGAFGTLTFWTSLALGLITGALVIVTQRGRRERNLPMWIDVVLGGLAVVLAAVSTYYVFRTGDSGAKSVWGS